MGEAGSPGGGEEEEEVRGQAPGRGEQGGLDSPWRWLAQAGRRGGEKAGSGGMDSSSGSEWKGDSLDPGGDVDGKLGGSWLTREKKGLKVSSFEAQRSACWELHGWSPRPFPTGP